MSVLDIGNLRPVSWLVCDELPDCFLALLDGGQVYTNQFYCRSCRAWKRISGTFHHIVAHYRIVRHSEETFEKLHEMSVEKNQDIRNALIWLFASHGLPFSIIDSPQLQHICYGLPHRRSLRAIVVRIAEDHRGEAAGRDSSKGGGIQDCGRDESHNQADAERSRSG